MQGFISDEWNLYLDQFPDERKDIYFQEEYVKLYEDEKNKAVCFVFIENDNIFLFPFLRRDFVVEGLICYDLETAYGYGGPVTQKHDEVFLKNGLLAFHSYCTNNQYVAGFVRFHPLLQNSKLYETIGKVIDDRKTVAIDISLSVEEIWMNEISTKNRNFIRKGEKNGLTFYIDNDYTYLDDFIRMYNSTMDKLNADTFYYFSNSYYSTIKRNKNSFLGVVLYDNKIVSSALFFYSKMYGHYHLSGSDRAYLSLYPNNFMLYNAALELKRRGVAKFHLGGGITSKEDDSLFKFKERFSKELYQFSIGRSVFNQNLYDRLVSNWVENNRNDNIKLDIYNNYLLKYKY